MIKTIIENKVSDLLEMTNINGVETINTITKSNTISDDFLSYIISKSTYQTEAINFDDFESVYKFEDETLLLKWVEFKKELLLNYKIDLTLLEQLAYEFVNLEINFVIKPISTLLDFIFENSSSQSADKILLKLNFFNYYSYLIENLKTYIYAQIDEELIEYSKIEIRDILLESEKFTLQNYQNVNTYNKLFFDFFKYFENHEILKKVLRLNLDDRGFEYIKFDGKTDFNNFYEQLKENL